MKTMDLAQIRLDYKDKRFTIAVTFLSLWIGFAVADFLAAATVVYSVGSVAGIKPEYAFWSPEGRVFMNFTWFGLGLLISILFTVLSLLYSLVCSLSRRAARREVINLNEKLKEAKSSVVEVCPIELWYSMKPKL
jgi:hypothetical protein